MRRGLAIAGLVAALVLPGGALAQGGSVEECIANNGPRYNSPADATTHQYVDSGGLCADAQDEDTEVDIVPIGGGTKPTPSPRTTAPAPAPQPPQATETQGVPATAPEPTGPTTTPPTAVPAPAARQGARGPAATASVTAALAGGDAERAGLSPAASLTAVPGGVLVALLAGLGLAGAGIGMRRFNRP